MVPAATIDRFRADLDALIDPGTRLGVAVSGGPDSMALLLLCASARPGEVEAATVDHGLRSGSTAEADKVAETCAQLGLPHGLLIIEWDSVPGTAIQERARDARYRALSDWMRSRELDALLTAHHLDDQAETVLMRLNRGSGSKGLAGMRTVSTVPGAPDLKLVRPLLNWRRRDLEAICADSGATTAADPSNQDDQFERVRIRRAMADADWLDTEAIARTAENLASAEAAIDWAANREWSERVTSRDGEISYATSGAPAEIVRRVVAKALAQLGREGCPEELRGKELSRLLDALRSGRAATLRGVHCSGEEVWTFTRANPRKS